MIELGSVDADVSDAAWAAYTKQVERLTRLPLSDVQSGIDKLVIKRASGASTLMRVAEVQQALKDLRFFPGATIDGICG